MISPALQPDVGWSRGRWLTVLLVLALGQGVTVWLVARWPRLPEPAPSVSTSFGLAFPGVGAGAAATDPLVGDPRQFAAADPQGFSGTAWRALPSAKYALAEWTAPSRRLAASPSQERLGTIPSLKSAPQLRAFGTAGNLTVNEVMAPLLLPTNSTVWPRGALAARPLENPAALAVLAGSDVLGPSLVEVAVAPAGGVMLVRLTGSSGSREADQLALAWARQARFRPERAGAGESLTPDLSRLTWGDLAFLWRVEPPTR